MGWYQRTCVCVSWKSRKVMGKKARPTILCTKCQSSVPWAAHCPHCWAYLEFAGDPPWRPEGLEEIPESDRAEATEEGLTPESAAPSDESPLGDEDPQEDVQSNPSLTEESLDSVVPAPDQLKGRTEDDRQASQERLATPEPVATANVSAARFNPRQVIAGIVMTVLTITLMVPVTQLTGWWFPVFLGPPLLAALLAASYLAFLDEPQPVAVERAAEQEVEEDLEEEEDFDPSAYTPQELQARRAAIHQKVVERTTTGDAICTECGRENSSTSHFCDWCGAIMPGVPLAPATRVISEPDEVTKKKRKKRGPTRTWRSTGPVFLIAVAVVGALAFAFFGPGAFQSRLSLTRLIQGFSQWVNPMVGRSATIQTVTASSSLPGTTPSALDANDASTFWASAVSPAMGENTVLDIVFDAPTEIDRMVILPGIQNKIFGRESVAYPKTIMLTFDDGSQIEENLEPIQSDEDLKQLIRFPARTTASVSLKVTAVYLPLGYKSGDYGAMAISGLEFLEPPQPPSAFGVQDRGLRQPTLPGTSGLP